MSEVERRNRGGGLEAVLGRHGDSVEEVLGGNVVGQMANGWRVGTRDWRVRALGAAGRRCLLRWSSKVVGMI